MAKSNRGRCLRRGATAAIMVDHDVGVSTWDVYRLKLVDSDYLESRWSPAEPPDGKSMSDSPVDLISRPGRTYSRPKFSHDRVLSPRRVESTGGIPGSRHIRRSTSPFASRMAACGSFTSGSLQGTLGGRETERADAALPHPLPLPRQRGGFNAQTHARLFTRRTSWDRAPASRERESAYFHTAWRRSAFGVDGR